MKVESLNTFNSPSRSFILSGKKYELKKFTLGMQALFTMEFATEEQPNGVIAFGERLAKTDHVIIASSSYFLLKDKKDFPDLESFISAFRNIYTLIGTLLAPLCDTINDANPEKQSEEEEQLKKF